MPAAGTTKHENTETMSQNNQSIVFILYPEFGLLYSHIKLGEEPEIIS